MYQFDQDYKGLMGLESVKINDEGEVIGVKKGDIFTKRINEPYFTPKQAENINQALEYSMRYQNGLDYDYMAKLLNKNAQEIRNELIADNKIYYDSKKGEVLEDTLLSGNIKQKLEELTILQNDPESAADEYLVSLSLEKLKNHLPKDKKFDEINVEMGNTFIPASVYNEIFNTQGFVEGFDGKVSYIYNQGALRADAYNQALGVKNKSFENKNMKPEDRAQAAREFQALVSDIKKEFDEKLASNLNAQSIIAKTYNEKFNIYATHLSKNTNDARKYDGATKTLRPTQNAAVQRAVHGDGNVLFNHEVGAGKTYTLITTAMELRRTNKAQKPLLAVPNHLVAQMSREFIELYPNARILSLQSIADRDFTQAFNQIVYNDLDAVIVGHSVLDKISMNEDIVRNYYNDMLDKLMDFESKLNGEGAAHSAKDIKKEINRIENKLEKLNERTHKKVNLNFDELGFDALLIDEAHYYKNLEFKTTLKAKGFGKQTSTDKTDNLLMITNYLNANNKKIVFATGTPISNSLTEFHTMMRYLNPKGLKEFGVEDMDSLLMNFMKINKALETKPDGSLQAVDTLIGTKNTATLKLLMDTTFDNITMKDVIEQAAKSGQKVKRPEVDNEIISIEKSPIVKDLFVKYVVLPMERLAENRKQAMEEGINDLVIFTNARKLSTDPRLVDGSLIQKFAENPELEKTTKLYQASEAVAKRISEFEAKTGERGTMIIFCDLLESYSSSFNTHKHLRKLLLEKKDKNGKALFTEKEVLSTDGMSKERLAGVFADMRAGRVRVLIGTRSSMGSGVNVQDRILGGVNVDYPYRPADYQQGLGRYVRQGNLLLEKYGDDFRVANISLSVKDTLDSRFLELLERKIKSFNQFYSGADTDFEIGGNMLEFYGEAKAASTGNKDWIILWGAEQRLNQLQADKNRHTTQFLSKPKTLLDLASIQRIKQEELKKIEAWQSVIHSNEVIFNNEKFKFDFSKSLNKPSTLDFESASEKEKLQALRDKMNDKDFKLKTLARLNNNEPVSLYEYGGASLIALRNKGEVEFYFDKDGTKEYLTGARQYLSNFTPSYTLNYIKRLQNNNSERVRAEYKQALQSAMNEAKRVEAIPEKFSEQELLDTLQEFYTEAKEELAKPSPEPLKVSEKIKKALIAAGVSASIFTSANADDESDLSVFEMKSILESRAFKNELRRALMQNERAQLKNKAKRLKELKKTDEDIKHFWG